MSKKAILVVSFGTSFEDTLKLTIGAIENSIAQAFPKHEVRRAFTSSIIIKIMQERGIKIDNVESALTRLKDEDFSEVLIQPLHLILGNEYHKLLSMAEPFRASFKSLDVGLSLFADMESYNEALDAIIKSLPDMPKDEAVVFMGHGTCHPANSTYSQIQLLFEDKNLPVYIGTVEGFPSLDFVIKKLTKAGIKKVTLYPLMLVAGDHAHNDMAGDEKDSWKSILEEKGFIVKTVLKGLGEIPSIQNIFVTRIKNLMQN